MLAGTVYFYDDFKNILLQIDINDFSMSNEKLFAKILELGATKVVVKGFSNNRQEKEVEHIIFSQRY